MYLLDTNTIIYFFKDMGKVAKIFYQNIQKKLLSHQLFFMSLNLVWQNQLILKIKENNWIHSSQALQFCHLQKERLKLQRRSGRNWRKKARHWPV